MDYKVYLQGEHWRLMRRLRREVDNDQCAICGSIDKLNVHHKTYERIGAEKLGDLITLCYECHGKYHDKLAKETFNSQKQNTVESFHERENLSNFTVEETYSILTIVNNTLDNYDLLIDGKNLGTIPNQKTVNLNKISSGLKEFVFKCGEKEKKQVEMIKGASKIYINYSNEELEGFVKELRSVNLKNPLTIENKNILNKVLEIKEVFPLLEHDGFMNAILRHKELLELLISKGYNINSNTKYNLTPLESSVQLPNNEEVYFLLINNGAIPTKKTLESALSKSSKRVIESILEHTELEPMFVYSIVENRNEGVLELLLEKGMVNT